MDMLRPMHSAPARVTRDEYFDRAKRAARSIAAYRREHGRAPRWSHDYAVEMRSALAGLAATA